MKNLLLLAACTLLISCAASYKGESPASYNHSQSNDEVVVKVDFGTRSIASNRQMGPRLSGSNYTIAKISLTNNTATPLTVGKNLLLTHANGNPIPLESGDIVYSTVRQRAGGHFAHLLQSGWMLTSSSPSGTSTFPIGLLIGPPIALGNFGVATAGNNRLKNEIVDNNVYNKTINPGDTLSGFITFNTRNVSTVLPKVM